MTASRWHTKTERRALIRLLKRTLDDDRYPLGPRLYPLKAILTKFEPAKPAPPSCGHCRRVGQ
jgi:hypothetical protein